jgi:hypothetical protein
MNLTLSPTSIADYRTFLKVKSLPAYHVAGRSVWFPDEYAGRLTLEPPRVKLPPYKPSEFLMDYQAFGSRLAIRKRRFSAFWDCGLGKTLLEGEFARYAAGVTDRERCILIIAPLMVIPQTLEEYARFYGSGEGSRAGSLAIRQLTASNLQDWLDGVGPTGERIGIVNFEALDDADRMRAGRLAGLIVDESSMLKSHYGKWGQSILRLGRGLEWKLAGTGTPAPNDRIEYANHAVLMDAYPTVNSFLARFFVNRGQTSERWELKAHAIKPFYKALSHWSMFMSRPAVYGFKDNAKPLPPIHVHIHDVRLTDEQRTLAMKHTGQLIHASGGIVNRGVMGQLAKGRFRGLDVQTAKPQFIRDLVDQWPDESTIIWCIYNSEQEGMARLFPDACNIDGDTPLDERQRLIAAFKAGRRKVMISKPKILGFGLNLQVATRMVWSGLQDSYEQYYQGVKRANRFGATRPLNVHIPVTELERPMVDTVLSKASMVQHDTEMQEALFRECFNTDLVV